MTSTAALGDIAEFVNGHAFKPDDWSDEGLPIIRIQNLTGSSASFNRSTKEVADKLRVRRGDLLVSWSATLGVYEWSGPEEGLLNQHIFRVLPKQVVEKSYLRYALKFALGQMSRHLHGATMQHVNRSEFLGTRVPLPPIDEQRRIAAILDKADEVRKNRRATCELQESFVRSMFLESFGDPRTNPAGWTLRPLGELGTLDRGVSKHRPRNDPRLLGGPHPLIQTGDVANCGGYIREWSSTYSDLGLLQSRLWPPGTLCITIAANIARTGILTFASCFPDSVVGFSASNSATVEYVRSWLSIIQKDIEDAAPESAQKNINLAVLRDLRIPDPPQPLKERFECALRCHSQSEERLRHSAEAASVLCSALQDSAFRGEL